jgi:hypothetical protein
MAAAVLSENPSHKRHASEMEPEVKTPVTLSQQENVPPSGPPRKKRKKQKERRVINPASRKGCVYRKAGSYTCGECHLNKRSCDGAMDKPCTRCAKRKVPLKCVAREWLKPGPKATAAGPKRVRHKKAPLATLSAVATIALASNVDDKHVSPAKVAAAEAVAMARVNAAAESVISKENAEKADAKATVELAKPLGSLFEDAEGGGDPITVNQSMLSNDSFASIGTLPPATTDSHDIPSDPVTVAYLATLQNATPLTESSVSRQQIDTIVLEGSVMAAAANATMANYDQKHKSSSSSVEIGSLLDSSPLKPPQRQQSSQEYTLPQLPSVNGDGGGGDGYIVGPHSPAVRFF